MLGEFDSELWFAEVVGTFVGETDGDWLSNEGVFVLLGFSEVLGNADELRGLVGETEGDQDSVEGCADRPADGFCVFVGTTDGNALSVDGRLVGIEVDEVGNGDGLCVFVGGAEGDRDSVEGRADGGIDGRIVLVGIDEGNLLSVVDSRFVGVVVGDPDSTLAFVEKVGSFVKVGDPEGD